MSQSEQFKAAADIEAETHLLSRGEARAEAEIQSLQSQLTQEREAAEQLRREARASEMARAVVADLRGIVESFGLADKLTAALAERDRFRQEVLSQTGCDESEFDEAFHKLGKPVVNRRNGQINQRWADALAERDKARKELGEAKRENDDLKMGLKRSANRWIEIANSIGIAGEMYKEYGFFQVTARIEQLQAAEKAIASLKAENEQLRAGAPLGPIIGAQTIVEQELELKSLRQELEEAKAACFMPSGYGSSLAEFVTREVWPASKTEDVETIAELRKALEDAEARDEEHLANARQEVRAAEEDSDDLRLWLRHFVTSTNMRKEFNFALASGFRPEQLREFRDVCLAVLNPGEREIVEKGWEASEAGQRDAALSEPTVAQDIPNPAACGWRMKRWQQ